MRITFETDGGFAAIPGLNRPFTVDTSADVEADVGRELVRLVRAARSSQHDRAAPASAPGGDRQTYRVVVEDKDSEYTLEYLEPVSSPEVNELIERLRMLSRGAR